MPVLGAVPVKPFASAKKRLASVLGSTARATISQELARRTLRCLVSSGVEAVVLAADDEVAEWARAGGWEFVLDGGSGLDQSARLAADRAASEDRAWIVVHADLPLLDPSHLAPAVESLFEGRPVIAPSRDGGTTLLGSFGSFDFSYGPASFHRHIWRLRDFSPLVLVDAALAVDLDDPSDLEFAAGRVPWLAGLLDTLPAP